MSFSLGAYLSLRIGKIEAVPVSEALIRSVESIQVKQSCRTHSGFQIVFTDDSTGLNSVSSILADSIAVFYRVGITILKGPNPIQIMDGFITHIEVSESDTEPTRVVVTGKGISVAMDIKETVMEYPAMPDSAIVEEVLAIYEAEYGIIPEIIPPPASLPPNPEDRIPVHRGTDYEKLKSLASQYGYLFYVLPGEIPMTNKAYWGPQDRAKVPQPGISMNLGGTSNVSEISFSINGLQAYSISGFIQDRTTNMTSPVDAPEPVSLPPFAAEPTAEVQQPFLSNRLYQPRGAESIMVAEKAALFQSNASTQQIVIGKGKLNTQKYGSILMPGTVGVQGAGISFDGLYCVEDVTTDITQNSISQSFEISREGLVETTPEVRPDV